MCPQYLIIDDRSSGSEHSNLGTPWRLVTDTVMGGVSKGQLTPAYVQGRTCLRMTGDVRLENNGGFVQASLDLGTDALLDASGYLGFEIDIYGNDETYNLHLRTADTRIVWQSFRVSFQAPPNWQTLRLPFTALAPYHTAAALDLRRLKRFGLVAIGRAFTADLCVARVALYR